MDASIHQQNVASLRKQIRILYFLLTVVVMALAIQATILLQQETTNERIVVVPPEVHSEFWIEQDKVSKTYFLEWGHYLVGLLLNVTPESIEYQTQVLLRYVEPRSYSAFAQRLANLKQHLQNEKLSTFFSVSDVNINLDQTQIAFTGTLSSYVEDRKIHEQQAAYMAMFAIKNGRLLLLEFVETTPSSVFTPKQSS